MGLIHLGKWFRVPFPTLMKLTPFVTTRFRSDGGAMFGLVPKTLWNRLISCDDRNCIPQNGNSWLIETDDGQLGLIDTGYGPPDLFEEKEKKHHGLENEWSLAASLEHLGTTRDEINFVILTHLHWDHAGGLICEYDPEIEMTFPNAKYYVHQDEWDAATGGNPLLYKAYPSHLIDALAARRNTHFILVRENKAEVVPGVRLLLTGGHSPGHCAVLLESDKMSIQHVQADSLGSIQRCVFAGDVCSSHNHLRMVFQMAYDNYPMATRKWKRKWLPEIAENGDLLMFDHDHEMYAATITSDDQKEFVVAQSLSTDLPA